ncbi:MAG: D-alanyl-D-alanine carboxypeptidase/D-alanyl-D-alanine-endopeptidase [Deltaproteobacteria bacterium]|nr:D-alanyl-D-alanine carboxypeptidase/D-alanyl-D-alanine-endopeptidase [Deltaproteobacteria bacterium]
MSLSRREQRATRLGLWCCCALWAAAGCRSTVRHAVAPPEPPVALADGALQAALDQALAGLVATGAQVGFLVLDAQEARVLAAHRSTELFTPASTTKLITTAAVLHSVDPGRRFVTRLLLPPPDGDGLATGDAWLVGEGDPSFGSARTLRGGFRPDDTLARAADAAFALGVRRVSGGVIGDGRVLPAPAFPPGWAWDDAAYAYSAPPAGLTLHEGVAWARLLSLDDTGPVAFLTPPTSLVRVRTGPQEMGRALELVPAGTDVVARWRPGPALVQQEEPVALADPAAYAAEQLARALRARGIQVDGPARSALAADGVPQGVTAFSRESPSVRELCALTNHHSLNLHAETLLLQVGRLTRGDASRAAGLEAVRGFLQSAGVTPAALRLVDGSGLSRMNLLAPAHLVAALRAAWMQDPAFLETLSVAGRAGSLEGRLVGTRLEGRMWGKTGSMTGHRNLAGALLTDEGRLLLFAFLAGGLVVPRAEVDAAVDRALAALARVHVTSASSASWPGPLPSSARHP